MDKITCKETIDLANGESYVCFGTIKLDKDYVYLVNEKNSSDIKVATQEYDDDGDLSIEIVTDGNLKEKLLDIFRKHINKK